MKKCFALMLALVSFSGAAEAVQFGLGVTIENRGSDVGNMVLVPISLSPSYFVEPFYYKNSVEVKDFTGLPGHTIGYDFSEIGMGLYYRSPVKDRLNFYMGVRGGYRVEEFSDDPVGGNTSNSALYGYSLAPVLGFQYEAIPRFLVGGEVDRLYTTVEGKIVRSSFQDSVSSRKNTMTHTRIVLRYLF